MKHEGSKIAKFPHCQSSTKSRAAIPHHGYAIQNNIKCEAPANIRGPFADNRMSELLN